MALKIFLFREVDNLQFVGLIQLYFITFSEFLNFKQQAYYFDLLLSFLQKSDK